MSKREKYQLRLLEHAIAMLDNGELDDLIEYRIIEGKYDKTVNIRSNTLIEAYIHRKTIGKLELGSMGVQQLKETIKRLLYLRNNEKTPPCCYSCEKRATCDKKCRSNWHACQWCAWFLDTVCGDYKFDEEEHAKQKKELTET